MIFTPTALDIALAMDDRAAAFSRAIMLAMEPGDLSPVQLPNLGNNASPWGRLETTAMGYALAVSGAKGSLLLVE